MSDARLARLRDLVQEDVGRRGLRTDPQSNLVSETADDFRAACASLAGASAAGLAIVTGFLIPAANPPAGETDGPLGAVFLARALMPLGIRVAIATDGFCVRAIEAGLAASGLEGVTMVTLPAPADAQEMTAAEYQAHFRDTTGHLGLTHLLAIERVGPSHTRHSGPEPLDRFLSENPEHEWDRCRTMRGIDITDWMSPAHWLLEAPDAAPLTTIGIGDGGNEIGMGKIPWDVIRRNIPRGGLVACRVPTDHLIVAAVSNWGAYALAAGLYLLRGVRPPRKLFDPVEERRILSIMVHAGPLVDGVLARPSVTVDGLAWDQYSAVLPQLSAIVEES
jgi:hypothetical protein